ncbi:hypothetical protein ACN47E_002795 [Coniothyrium glycines]
MALSNAHKVAIAVVLLIMACTIITSIIMCRKYSKRPHKHADNEQSSRECESSTQTSLPGEDQKNCFSTFYNWLRTKRHVSTITPRETEQGLERFASLENGPGPILETPTTIFDTTAARSKGMVTRVERPMTSGSGQASSLRHAVLDVASKSVQERRADVEETGTKPGAPPKGYTGAWP